MSPRLPGRRGDGDEWWRLPLVSPGDEGETPTLVSVSPSPGETGRHVSRLPEPCCEPDFSSKVDRSLTVAFLKSRAHNLMAIITF